MSRLRKGREKTRHSFLSQPFFIESDPVMLKLFWRTIRIAYRKPFFSREVVRYDQTHV